MFRKYRLFCFPYAGGSCNIYYKWEKYIPSNIILNPIELPGHGEKIDLEPLESMEDITKAVIEEIKDSCKFEEGENYVLFGHSMGTMIICELIRQLKSEGYPQPVHVFMSGRFPPHIPEKTMIHNLPDSEFLRAIINMGGIPKDVVSNKLLLEFFLPILRADYTAVEKYSYTQDEKWDFPISVFLGKEDIEVKNYDYMAWKLYTASDCKFYEFNGNHFFINDFTEEITGLINQILCN